MQMDTADAADLCELLEIFSDMYWHPSEAFLTAAQARLTASVNDMPLVSICTSLWTFATFAFIPAIAMQKAFANRIEADLEGLNAYQVCSLLWVYALFRTCTQGVWNTLVGRLAQFDIEDINESALKYLYQVLLSPSSTCDSCMALLPESAVSYLQMHKLFVVSQKRVSVGGLTSPGDAPGI
jgi:hypothetical protein